MKFKTVLCCCILLFGKAVMAEEVAAKQQARLTSMDIMRMLVKEGILSEQRAEELVQAVAAEKINDNKKSVENDTVLDTKTVRVPYVPQFIKDDIRDQVRLGLREEVVTDVIEQAKHERWGVPGVLPDWINRIKFKGDYRLRYQGDYYSDSNALPNPYLDFQHVNETGTIDTDEAFYHNVTEDRNRWRARIRLAMDAKVTQGVNIGMRVASGKFEDPVSTNQTLGNSSQPYRLVLDRAFIKINSEYDDLTFWGGRMPNPWKSTDLVWDKDLNFEGVAFKYRPLQSGDLDNDERVFDTFITLGAFPLKEVEYSSKDKWLLGVQTGFNWTFTNQNKLDINLAYYDYRNIEGIRNTSGSDLLDYTAPDFMQQGNTLYEISDPTNVDLLFGLVSDYDLVDIMIAYKIAQFAPVNLTFTADYVRNIGYKKDDVLARDGASGGGLTSAYGNVDGEARVNGYLLKLDIGWPNLLQRNNWQAGIAFKHLERDAVIDAFTDSDFRNGGTDAEGWIVQGKYAFEDNTWLSLKLISADEIDGAPYGVDTLQLDLQAVF